LEGRRFVARFNHQGVSARQFFCAVALQWQSMPLESVAVFMLMTKAITLKTTGFGGAVSGARTV
jgi:hypothetical protein